MAKYLILMAACLIIAGVACANRSGGTPTQVPTPSGPALSVEEYTKACYAAYEKTLNDRGRSSTQEQMRRLIADLRELSPPRSLEKFHYAYLQAWEVTVDEGIVSATKEWTEADAQIGQLDDETYTAFMQRGACGFDERGF